ncbi:MAG: hypothetical protein GY898_23915 [Proteobacteria bacterium]|nr:hypothetical protein [Pseudomonadota bacterium]
MSTKQTKTKTPSNNPYDPTAWMTDPNRAAETMREAMLTGIDGMLELNQEFARATAKTLEAMKEQIDRMSRPAAEA